jgi:hypothetical protein
MKLLEEAGHRTVPEVTYQPRAEAPAAELPAADLPAEEVPPSQPTTAEPFLKTDRKTEPLPDAPPP